MDRYSLEHYLTDIAETYWCSRAEALSHLKTPTDVAGRAHYIRTEFLKDIGGFPGGADAW